MVAPIMNSNAGVPELKHQLAQREAELQIINSVQLGLMERLDVQAIYNLVGDKIRDIFQAQVVMISTYDKQTQTIEHRYAFERGERIYAPGLHPIRGFRIWVVESRQPVLVSANVAQLAAELGQPTLPGTITPKTWLGVPMLVGDQVTGILSLQDVDREHAFDEAVVRLLQTLAASMSVALENARLWEQESLYRKALEREFEIGRQIQQGFLPKTLPQPAGWEIAAALHPAREVAGDFYDVFELPDGKIGLMIGDVCDKGLGAALFMTQFRSLLRALSSAATTSSANVEGSVDRASLRLKNAMSLTNEYIADLHGDTGMFATVFFGALDPHSGTLTYINGGHLPPLLIDAAGMKAVLGPSGPAVGAVADADFVVRRVHVEPGASLFAYTDGLTDAASPQGELFAEEQFVPLFSGKGSPASALEEIRKRLLAHCQGIKQFDDITMLAVRRSPS